MKHRKTYKEDFDGISLLRTSFPKIQDTNAIKLTVESEKNIKVLGQKLFFTNRQLFEKLGLDSSDVTSLITVYTYVFYSKKHRSKFLNNFLRQRSLKLIELCKRKTTGIADEIPILEDGDIDELYSHNDNPEEMLLAKEKINDLFAPALERAEGKLRKQFRDMLIFGIE